MKSLTKLYEAFVAYELEVKPIKNGKTYKFGIFAGKANLQSFKTEADANEALVKGRKNFEYWANSASVSIQNTKPKVLNP